MIASPSIANNTIDYLLRKAVEQDGELQFLGKMAPYHYALAKKWFRESGATFENERSCVLRRDDGTFSLKYLEAIKKIEFRYCAKGEDIVSLPIAVPTLPQEQDATPVIETPDLNMTGTLGLAHVMQQNLAAILNKIRGVPGDYRDSFLRIETRPLPGDNMRTALYFIADNGDEDFIGARVDKPFSALIHWQTWNDLIPLLSPERVDIELTQQEWTICDQKPSWGHPGKYHTETRLMLVLRCGSDVSRLLCPDESKLLYSSGKTVVSAKSKGIKDYTFLAKAVGNGETRPALSWGYVIEMWEQKCAWTSDGTRIHIVKNVDSDESFIQFKKSGEKPTKVFESVGYYFDLKYTMQFQVNSEQLRAACTGKDVDTTYWMIKPDGSITLMSADTWDENRTVKPIHAEFNGELPEQTIVIALDPKYMRDMLPNKSKAGTAITVSLNSSSLSPVQFEYGDRIAILMPKGGIKAEQIIMKASQI